MSDQRSLRTRAALAGATALVVAAIGLGVYLTGRGDAGGRVNILFITVDSLRADHLGVYGYDRDTSPATDELARRGVLFERAVSQATWTYGSVPSFVTSRYPQSHRRIFTVDDGNVMRRGGGAPGPIVLLGEEDVALPAVLKAAGYKTALVTDHDGLGQIVGLRSSFDDMEVTRGPRTVEAFKERALDKLRGLAQQKPFFLWVYFNGLHYPYRPPPEYGARFQNDGKHVTGKTLPFSDQIFGVQGAIPAPAQIADRHDVDFYVASYDGCISAIDAAIAELMAELTRLGLDGSTLVVLNADHGELLGEGGYYFTHGATLHPANIHVPLVFVLPGHAHGGTRVAATAALLDLAPTILDVAGVSAARMAPLGRSLLPCFATPSACDGGAAFAEAHRAAQFGVVSDRWFLRCGDGQGCGLFDFDDKSEPPRDFHAEYTDEARGLERRLTDWRQRYPAAPPRLGVDALDADTRDALRNLGYIR